MRNNPKIYIVTGMSGSGKTTVARELIKRGDNDIAGKMSMLEELPCSW